MPSHSQEDHSHRALQKVLLYSPCTKVVINCHDLKQMKIARAREKECLGVGVVGLMHEACMYAVVRGEKKKQLLGNAMATQARDAQEEQQCSSQVG